MYNLEFTVNARIDLEHVFMYSLENFGEAQAIKYKEELNESLIKVSCMPGIGHARKDLPLPYLSYTTGQHSLIYEVDEKEKLITIIRILHSRMDFSNRF